MQSISYNWNNKSYKEFLNELIATKEESFKKFQEKIIYTKYEILGIRTPILRGFGKRVKNTNIEEFLNIIKPKYFEETLLEGIVIQYIKDYDTFIKYFKVFINHVDNWATCDMSVCKFLIIRKNKDKYLDIINELVNSNNPNYIRIGIVSILYHYLEDDKYIDYIFRLLDSISNNDYYVEMSIAWLISIMFIKYRNKTIRYLENNNLSIFTQNKAISKIRDSYRVSKEDKELVLKYKRG